MKSWSNGLGPCSSRENPRWGHDVARRVFFGALDHEVPRADGLDEDGERVALKVAVRDAPRPFPVAGKRRDRIAQPLAPPARRLPCCLGRRGRLLAVSVARRRWHRGEDPSPAVDVGERGERLRPGDRAGGPGAELLHRDGVPELRGDGVVKPRRIGAPVAGVRFGLVEPRGGEDLALLRERTRHRQPLARVVACQVARRSRSRPTPRRRRASRGAPGGTRPSRPRTSARRRRDVPRQARGRTADTRRSKAETRSRRRSRREVPGALATRRRGRASSPRPTDSRRAAAVARASRTDSRVRRGAPSRRAPDVVVPRSSRAPAYRTGAGGG